MKKPIILALLALFTLASCGQKDSPSSSTSKPSTETSKPSTDTSKPSTDTSKPSTDTSKPSTDTSKPSTDTSKPSTDTTKPSTDSSKPIIKDFENVVFESQTVNYDGNTHSLKVTNIPEGTKVTYTDNDKIEVGTYYVKALLQKEGYNEKIVEATLTILPIEFKGIEFKNETFIFDDNYKTVSITGNLPQTATVTYSCKEDPTITNKIKDPGTYTITATIKDKNYKELSLVATFTIKSQNKEKFITSFKDEIYFQNPLDKDNLYKITLNNEVKKVNSNNAQYFTTYKDNLVYRSDSLIVPSIVSYNGTVKDTLFTDNAEYIVDDENYIYYAKNSLVGEKGIYKLDLSTSEPTSTKIYDGNAYDLNIVNDKIYFRTKENISYINLANNTSFVLLDQKIKTLISDNNNLYYTVNNTKGDFIEKYNLIENKQTKLTSDAGKNLVVVNNDLYYVNADLLNANLFGKGIYKVSTNPLTDYHLPGKLVIEQQYKNLPINSLTYFNNSLYFYETVNQHLYSYNIYNKQMVDLMSSFVPKEPALLKGDKAASITYKDVIYYQNQYDDNCLYSYNPQTKQNIRITSNKVDDLYVYNDYLYYRSISYLVNKDLYRIDLRNNTTTLISTNDCQDLTIYNDKIYYVNYSGNNSIHMMNLDGSNDTLIHDNKAYNLEINNNKLYFIKDSGAYSHGYIYSINLNDPSYSVTKFENCRTSFFKIYNDKIIYRSLSGVAYKDKQLSICDLDGTNNKVLIEGIDPTDFVINNNIIYYNNDVTKNYSINSYNLETNENKVIKKDVYAYGLQYLNGKLYYHSYLNGTAGLAGDGHFYELSLDGTLNRIN